MSSIFCHKIPHPVVSYTENPRQVVRATVKTLLLTGTYPLQVTKHKMKKSTTPTCLLCHRLKEDTHHFIMECHALRYTRSLYMPRIKDIMPKNLKIPLLYAILDSRSLIKYKRLNIKQTEAITRDFIYALHIARSNMLDPTKSRS